MATRSCTTDMDMNKITSAIPVAIGTAMIALAALDYLPEAVAITLIVVGAGLICVGMFSHRLEDKITLGPRGFEGTLAKRIEAVVEAADDTDPFVSDVVRATAGTIAP